MKPQDHYPQSVPKQAKETTKAKTKNKNKQINTNSNKKNKEINKKPKTKTTLRRKVAGGEKRSELRTLSK
jgi:hypothetical protein